MEIPATVRGLLWEYDLDALAADEQWQQAVIERVMQRGTWEQMRWLARSFDRATLAAFLGRRGRRALAPRELRFWLTMTGVDPALCDAWVVEARAREQAWRG
jgi:hypothetical protein